MPVTQPDLATRIAIDGLVACVPFSVVVWASFLWRPRIWLHALPADIQRMAGPKTPAERRLTGWLGALVLFTFFGVPALLTWRLQAATPGGLSFGQIATHLYGVWMTVNAWDLIGIDWPYAYLVDPNRPPIPGTEGAKGYKDYRFHAGAFLKASVFGLAFILPAAARDFATVGRGVTLAARRSRQAGPSNRKSTPRLRRRAVKAQARPCPRYWRCC